MTGYLRRHSLIIGLLLMFAFTWPVLLSGSGRLQIHFPAFMYMFLGWGFVAASLLMTALTQGRAAVAALLERFLIWRVGWRWYAALLLIPLIDLTGILIHAAVTRRAPDFASLGVIRAFGVSSALVLYGLGSLLIGGFVNGEEIGWRGYALPRLQARYSALYSALVIGLVWGLWHIPIWLPHWNGLGFSWYVLSVMAKSVLMAWLYNNTRGSLLVVTLAHAAYNTAALYLPMTAAVPPLDMGAFPVIVLVEIAAAAVIVIASGPAHLSRFQARQAA